MLLPLRTERRRTLLRTSLCALAGALLLAPLGFPIASPAGAGAKVEASPPADPPFAQAPQPSVEIARDPFVPDAATQPADAGSGAGGAAIAVEAVALGESARALVRDGSASRIVRVGDALEDSTVSAIDARGVLLENGDVLPFTAAR